MVLSVFFIRFFNLKTPGRETDPDLAEIPLDPTAA